MNSENLDHEAMIDFESLQEAIDRWVEMIPDQRRVTVSYQNDNGHQRMWLNMFDGTHNEGAQYRTLGSIEEMELFMSDMNHGEDHDSMTTRYIIEGDPVPFWLWSDFIKSAGS